MEEIKISTLNDTDLQMLDKIKTEITDAIQSNDKKRIKSVVMGLNLFALYTRYEIIFKRKDGGNDTRKQLLNSIKGFKKSLKAKGML